MQITGREVHDARKDVAACNLHYSKSPHFLQGLSRVRLCSRLGIDGLRRSICSISPQELVCEHPDLAAAQAQQASLPQADRVKGPHDTPRVEILKELAQTSKWVMARAYREAQVLEELFAPGAFAGKEQHRDPTHRLDVRQARVSSHLARHGPKRSHEPPLSLYGPAYIGAGWRQARNVLIPQVQIHDRRTRRHLTVWQRQRMGDLGDPYSQQTLWIVREFEYT